MDRVSINRQVSPEHYTNKTYDSLGRFNSYWHQIHEVTALAPETVLEVGVGNRFVAEYLLRRGISVTSVDIDPELSPTAVASVDNLPFQAAHFDIAMCCQVLEHMPYVNSLAALDELKRVSRRYVLISIPDRTYYYGVHFHLPGLGRRQIGLSSRRIKPMASPRVEEEHYWEIGIVDYSLSRLKNDLHAAGFRIVKNYRVHFMPMHRFLLLEAT